MGNSNEFIIYLENSVNKDIYVWGGQKTIITSEDQIKRMETSLINANRAIALYRKRKEMGINPVYADDCSGLMMGYLQNQVHIYSSDMTANGIMGKCTMVSKSNLKKGCFVFRVSSGRAYHVGFVVDDALNVVESMGRDDGVVKRTLNASGSTYWNAFGYLPCFADDINTASPVVTTIVRYTRLLKFRYPYMRGNDVKAVQQALMNTGYSCGSIDGVFGRYTQTAVKAYQKYKKLTVDGIVGLKTWNALFN